MNPVPTISEDQRPSAVKTPLQRSLGLTGGTIINAPLVGIETARAAFRDFAFDEDDIMAEILECNLIAFDLRGESKSKRSFIRIFTPSIDAFKQHLLTTTEGRGPKVPNPSIAFDTIFAAIIRHSKPVITSPELHRLWNCGSNHIHHLLAQKLLTITPTSPSRHQDNAPAHIPRESVAAFMKARQL